MKTVIFIAFAVFFPAMVFLCLGEPAPAFLEDFNDGDDEGWIVC